MTRQRRLRSSPLKITQGTFRPLFFHWSFSSLLLRNSRGFLSSCHDKGGSFPSLRTTAINNKAVLVACRRAWISRAGQSYTGKNASAWPAALSDFLSLLSPLSLFFFCPEVSRSEKIADRALHGEYAMLAEGPAAKKSRREEAREKWRASPAKKLIRGLKGERGRQIKYEWSGSPSNPGYEPATAMQLLLLLLDVPMHCGARIPNCRREDSCGYCLSDHERNKGIRWGVDWFALLYCWFNQF